MSESRGFFATLLATPEAPLSKLSRYTFWNGVLYVAVGAAMYAGPASILIAATGTPVDQVGTLRVIGMAVAFIGWFYMMGARTGAASFGLATVVDRLLVPFLLGGLVLSGQVMASQIAGFAILDPILALGALFIWRSER